MHDPNSIKSPKIKKKVQATIKAINKAQTTCVDMGCLSKKQMDERNQLADASTSDLKIVGAMSA